MKIILTILGIILPVIIAINIVFAKTNTSDGTTQAYGSITHFSKNEWLKFPDFSIRYVGRTSEPGPDGTKWSISYQNFEVNDGDKTQKISWSSGTGLVAPSTFEVKGKTFLLEKAKSNFFVEWLGNNKFVISPKTAWQNKSETIGQ